MLRHLSAMSQKILEKKYFKKTASGLIRMVPLAAALIYLLFISIPILAIIAYGLPYLRTADFWGANKSSLLLSFKTSLISTLLVFLLGTPVVFLLGEIADSRVKRLIENILQFPVVLPPAIAGIGLLLAFGRRGTAGRMLSSLGIQLGFSAAAVIMAQFFVSSAYYIQVLRTAAESVPKEITDAAYICGAGKLSAAARIILPMLRRAVVSGLGLSMTRSMGEFGATIMFAGNVPGRTRTLPLQIYTLMQTDVRSAAAAALMLFGLSFMMLLAVKAWVSEQDMYE